MKSRKVKAAAKRKAFVSKKKLKGDIPLDASDGEGPDVDSDSFYHDEIDDFHREKDEKLSSDDELIQHREESSEEEEVLPITDDDDDKDEWEEEKRAESEEEKDDLPNLDSWGKKKSMYYNTDFVDQDRGKTYREEDEAAAKAEEEEALAIQKSLISGVSAENFASIYSKFEGSDESSEEELEDTTPNLNEISKQDKLRILKKTSPELLTLIKEFKEKMCDVREKIVPLLDLVNTDKLQSEECKQYLKLKYQLSLQYCMNISFYMMLKSEGALVSNHPVLQRIINYKELLDRLKLVDEKINDETDILLEKIRKGEEIRFRTPHENTAIANFMRNLSEPPKGQKRKSEKSKEPKTKRIETETEKEVISLYTEMKKQQRQKQEEVASDDDVNEEMAMEDDDATEEKRTINYKIAKNRGLTPHRKKELRNPRVHLRMKYRKAKIRRKGQVRETIKELRRYEGEPTGISTHVVKSIKLK